MTEHIDASDVGIDTEQLVEYVQQYKQTENRETQREIENQVLSETVWKTHTESQTETLTLNEKQIRLIYQELPDHATETKRILRSHLIDDL